MQRSRQAPRVLSESTLTRLKILRLMLLAFIPIAIIDYSHTGIVDSTWLYGACGVISSIGLAAGAWWYRPARATGWYLMSLGILLFVAGDVIYIQMSMRGPAPYPGLPDVFYLAGYPVIALGLAFLARGRSASRANLIDALILSTGAALAAWTFLIRPYALDLTLSVGARLVSVAYPLGDLVLLAVVCWFFIGSRQRSVSLRWLGVAMVALLVSDTLYGATSLSGTYVGGWMDGGYIVSYVALALAALHPSMSKVGQETRTSSPRLSLKRLTLLAASATVGPVLLIKSIEDSSTSTVDLRLLAVGSLLLFLLSVFRIGGLARAIDRYSQELSSQSVELSALVDKLKELEKDRRYLHDAVITAGETERSALAMDLHDGPIQQLSTIGLELELTLIELEGLGQNDSAARLQSTFETLTDQVSSLRGLMSNLRPPVLDERGLAAGLVDLISDFERVSSVRCEVGVAPVSIPRDVETLLYRVAQELITNIRKHAGATGMSLILSEPGDGLLLEIADDGVGFDESELAQATRVGHIGLASIAERVDLAGGTYALDSRPGVGTRITIEFAASSLGKDVPDALIASG